MKTRLFAACVTLATVLSVPSVASALDINKDFKPQNEFKLDPWIELKLGPIDLSINKAVLYIVAAGLFATLLMLWVAKKMQQRPNRIQTIVETAFVFMRDDVTGSNIDNKAVAKRWFPFVLTLFFFIWFSNMLGYLPLPTNTEHTVNIFGLDVPSLALYAATANLSVPLVLTLMVWLSYHFEGVRDKGFAGYVKSWVPSGISGPVLILVAPIEVLSQFVRLVSLSARLFANILAGHLLILIMGGGLVVLLNLGVVGSLMIGAITTPIAVAFFLFEVGLVATLQAFIFATLSAIYLGGATADSH